MKKVMLMSVALALVLAASTAQAERPDRGGRHGSGFENRIERMAKELDLTAEQSEQLVAVFAASAAENEVIREKIDEQFGPELCALRLATEEQVSQILTAEQQAKLDEMKARKAVFAEERGARGDKGPRGDFQKDCEPSA